VLESGHSGGQLVGVQELFGSAHKPRIVSVLVGRASSRKRALPILRRTVVLSLLTSATRSSATHCRAWIHLARVGSTTILGLAQRGDMALTG